MTLHFDRPRVKWSDLTYQPDLTHRPFVDIALHAAFSETSKPYTDGFIAECKAPRSMRCPVWAVRRSDEGRVRYVCTNVCRACSWRRDETWTGPALQLRNGECEPHTSERMRGWIRATVSRSARIPGDIGLAARCVVKGDWRRADERIPRKSTHSQLVDNRERLTAYLLDHIAQKAKVEQPWRERRT